MWHTCARTSYGVSAMLPGFKQTMKQPPGGDCHDLFGAEFKGSPCHHRVLKPPGGGTSDIFGAAEGVEQSPRRARNTHHLQSSVFGANGASEAPSTPRTKPARRNPVTGDGVCSSDSILRRSTKKRDGNPVTGEGYSAVNGEKESSPANGTSSAEARRNRVPPGGYSSGLW
ncbi:microtubule-associated protein Jupiter isoform X7 [Periplaneta americana]|uniref:microtubule-associated protein Jupiter isoform X7 n=1 Tax=Periplaneta americana TaxID=6978 RepID=UPI0037E9398B